MNRASSTMSATNEASVEVKRRLSSPDENGFHHSSSQAEANKKIKLEENDSNTSAGGHLITDSEDGKSELQEPSEADVSISRSVTKKQEHTLESTTSKDPKSDSSTSPTPDNIADDSKITEPTKGDVLLGRGKPFQNHPGNQRMLTIVDSHKESYLGVKRDKKRAIVEEVIREIQEDGARFLKRSEDGHFWNEVESAISFEKVSHALRSKVRRPDGPNGKESSPATPVSMQIASEALRFAGMQGGAPAPLYPQGLFPCAGLYGHDAAALGLAAPGMLPPQLYGQHHHHHHHGLVPAGSPHAGSGLDQFVRSQVVDTLLRQRRQLDDALNGVAGGMRLPPYM